MTLLWMLASIAVALATGLAALAMERAARAVGRPTRGWWVAALLFSTLWPAWLVARAALPGVAGDVTGDGLLPPFVVEGSRALGRLAHEGAPGWLDAAATLALVVWGVASVLLLVRLGAGVVLLRRRRAAWAPREVGGVRVLVSPDAGPAVVGVRRPVVVLPAWSLDLDAPLLALVLRHECEHVRARDTVLRWAGALATALVPWNPAVWWQVDRLALAIEVDCDARVLRAGARRERYGLLLLTIAQRQGAATLAPALSEPTSHLERRITVMHASQPRHRLLTAGALTAAATLALVVACVTPTPDRAAGPAQGAQAMREFQLATTAVPKQGSPTPLYPDSLKAAGVEGEVLVQFIVGPDGNVDPASLKVLRSSHPLFEAEVRRIVPLMKFTPATVEGGRPVRSLLQFPFSFETAK